MRTYLDLQIVSYRGSQLKRVGILSSIVAISSGFDTGLLDENTWNTTSPKLVEEKGRDADQASKYRASKSLAEQGVLFPPLISSWSLVVEICKVLTCYAFISVLIAAWAFVKQHETEITWDLVTLCPPFVSFLVIAFSVHIPFIVSIIPQYR